MWPFSKRVYNEASGCWEDEMAWKVGKLLYQRDPETKSIILDKRTGKGYTRVVSLGFILALCLSLGLCRI